MHFHLFLEFKLVAPNSGDPVGPPCSFGSVVTSIPGANPTAVDLPLYHGVSHIIYLLESKFLRHQLVKLQVVLHYHVCVPGCLYG